MNHIEIAIAALQDADTDAEWDSALSALWLAHAGDEHGFRNDLIDYADFSESEIDAIVAKLQDRS